MTFLLMSVGALDSSYFRNGVLLPNTIVTHSWNAMMQLFALYNIIFVPLQIASPQLQVMEALTVIDYVRASSHLISVAFAAPCFLCVLINPMSPSVDADAWRLLLLQLPQLTPV